MISDLELGYIVIDFNISKNGVIMIDRIYIYIRIKKKRREKKMKIILLCGFRIERKLRYNLEF